MTHKQRHGSRKETLEAGGGRRGESDMTMDKIDYISIWKSPKAKWEVCVCSIQILYGLSQSS